MRIGPNIYKRQDGRWEARIMIGKRADGKPQYKSLYARSYRDVSLAKKDFQNNVHFNAPVSMGNTVLFSVAAKDWLEHNRKNWKPSTYNKYKNYETMKKSL